MDDIPIGSSLALDNAKVCAHVDRTEVVAAIGRMVADGRLCERPLRGGIGCEEFGPVRHVMAERLTDHPGYDEYWRLKLPESAHHNGELFPMTIMELL